MLAVTAPVADVGGARVVIVGAGAAARLETTDRRAAVAVEDVAIVAFLARVEDAIAAVTRREEAAETGPADHARDRSADALTVGCRGAVDGDGRARAPVAHDGDAAGGGIDRSRQLDRACGAALPHDVQAATALHDVDHTADDVAEAGHPDPPATGQIDGGGRAPAGQRPEKEQDGDAGAHVARRRRMQPAVHGTHATAHLSRGSI